MQPSRACDSRRASGSRTAMRGWWVYPSGVGGAGPRRGWRPFCGPRTVAPYPEPSWGPNAAPSPSRARREAPRSLPVGTGVRVAVGIPD